jgi:isopenicillin N synthase-like dioxygenase
MSSFEEIPVLDWSLLSAGVESRAKFISQLRSAMTEVGFLYLLNPPIDDVCHAHVWREHQTYWTST